MSEQTDNAGSQALPKPYSAWFHPEKTWRDILFFKFIGLFLPLSKLAKLPPSKDSPETLKALNEVRKMIDDNDKAAFQKTAFRWKKAARCENIVHVEVTDIPHKSTFLKDWGIQDKANAAASKNLFDHGAKTHVFFPSSLLNEPLSPDEENELDSYGCLPAKATQVDWNKFDPTIPIVVYFHGGAMIMGGMFNPDGLEPFARMVEQVQGKPVILISPEYRLAPEHPFPAGAVDVLTTMDWILEEAFPKHKVQISGISAGGYYGTVAIMEYVRRYGLTYNRIVGASLHCPCSSPSADTLSYYMNDGSSFVDTDFCRWINQCFCELPPSKDIPTKPAETLEELLGQNSNRTTWEESPWKGSDWERLADPRVDLPQ